MAGKSFGGPTPQHYDVGVVTVSGSSDVVDRVVGLEIGADDSIGQPFDPRELLARVKSVLRRKIEPDPAGEPRVIRTLRNAGYRYVPDPG